MYKTKYVNDIFVTDQT